MNISHGTQGISHMHHDIPHGTENPHSTAHTLYRMLMGGRDGDTSHPSYKQFMPLPPPPPPPLSCFRRDSSVTPPPHLNISPLHHSTPLPPPHKNFYYTFDTPKKITRPLALSPYTIQHNPPQQPSPATICFIASVWIRESMKILYFPRFQNEESMSLFKVSGSKSIFKASISINIYKKFINI